MVKVELHDPIKRRIKKIFRRAVFYEWLMYQATATAGYLSFLGDTPELIVDRDALPGYADYTMLVGRIGTIVLMCTSITIMGAPCRKQILTLIGVLKENKKG